MTDEQSTTPPSDEGATNPTSSPADETFGWTADPNAPSGDAATGNTAERMVAQLQSMIDSIATQAAPVVRQVGIKAAELAAAAADRAGPIAHKPPMRPPTQASRSRSDPDVIAADLRASDVQRVPTAVSSATAVLDGVDDPSEQAARTIPPGLPARAGRRLDILRP